MPSFGTEPPYSRGNLGGKDGMSGRKEGLVTRNKAGHFMVKV